MTSPIVPEHIRAAIHAGHIGQVTIFCDHCGVEECADYTGETREVRFAAARWHLAETKGWRITATQDLCPKCNVPDQPDGIDDDSRDLPDPVTAAERVREYIAAWGDGIMDIADGHPLYARDLEAVCRAVLAAHGLGPDLPAPKPATPAAKAPCPVCGQKFGVTKQGVIRHHKGKKVDWDGNREYRCDGAGKPPTGTPGVETVELPGVTR